MTWAKHFACMSIGYLALDAAVDDLTVANGWLAVIAGWIQFAYGIGCLVAAALLVFPKRGAR